MLDNKSNGEKFFETSKSLGVYQKFIDNNTFWKKELLDRKDILVDLDESLDSLLLIRDNLQSISKMKSEINNNYRNVKDELNQEFNQLKEYDFQKKFESSIHELSLRANAILSDLKNYVLRLNTPLKEKFETFTANFDFKEKVEISKLISLIEKLNQSLSKLGQGGNIEGNILELSNVCLTILSINRNHLYEEDLLSVELERKNLINDFTKNQTTLDRCYANIDSLLKESASENYKKAEEIKKNLDSVIDNFALSNQPELPTEYKSNYDFLFATKNFVKNKNNNISFPELGFSKTISLDIKDIFKIPLGTDTLSNVIIKTNKNLKDDKDFIKGLDALFYRYLITFPGLSKQVCAMHKQIGSPLTIIDEISSKLTRCVLSLNGSTSLIDTEDSIKRALESMGSLINSRKGELRKSQKKFNNIYEYNVENTDNIQNPIFLLIKDFPVGFEDPNTLENLSQIFGYSQEIGIFIVLIDCVDNVNKYNELLSKSREEIYSKAGYIFEHIGGSILKRENELLDLKFIRDDFTFTDFSKSLMDKMAEADKPITLESINPNWEKIQENPNFSVSLDIPIGKEGGNVKYIHLTSKDTTVNILANGKVGSGKSEFLHTLILSSAMNYSPEELQIILIDFKDGVEFNQYIDSFPQVQFLALKGTSTDAVDILNYLVEIKEKNNDKFKKLDNSKDIDEYNTKAKKSGLPLVPRTLIVIDEYHKAIMNNQFITKLESIAREGRSAGMSLVLVSQSIPSIADFRIIKEQMGNLVAFPSDDMYTIIPECEKRQSELDSLKGLCFIKVKSEVSKVRVAYTGNGEEKKALINKIRNKYKAYPIQTKNVSRFEKRSISNNNSLQFASSLKLVEEELAIKVNFGIYRLTQTTLNYDINRNNKLLVVLGGFGYAQHIFLSIIREYINFNAQLNLSKEIGNVFFVDLNENIILKRKTTIISQLHKKCGNLDTNLRFIDGTKEFIELLDELNELYNARMENSSLELYPIQVFVSNADKMSVDNRSLLNLLQNGENVGIYFTFHFEDITTLTSSHSEVIRNVIRKFKDSIIVPNSTDDMSSMYVSLYNNVDSKEIKEVEKGLAAQGLEDIYGLINDDGKISKFIMNQYNEQWVDSLFEEPTINKSRDF